ncbi:peptidase inhibitor family I36 protein [Kitasatospora purpeofusca]|uniref:peptidase inhibitor family I36 protein n=1 Tax=Kitasatospora purpeofusca TaxID=67352 RepID=UPI003866448E|nr:peptidase inhibitor family I36 protein [Kitasatospora purpeofusca]
MKMYKSRMALVGIGAAVLVSLAAPAQAQNYNGVCEPGDVCLWADPDFTGSMVDWDGDQANYNYWTYSTGNIWKSPNDDITAISNHGWWYDVKSCNDPNYSGQCLWTDSSNNRNWLGGTFNDLFSSHVWG